MPTSRGIQTKVTKKDITGSRITKGLVDTVPSTVSSQTVLTRSWFVWTHVGLVLDTIRSVGHLWYRGTLHINQYSVMCPGVRSHLGSCQGFRATGPACKAVRLGAGWIWKPPDRDRVRASLRMKIHQLMETPYTCFNWGQICWSPKHS